MPGDRTRGMGYKTAFAENHECRIILFLSLFINQKCFANENDYYDAR